MVQNVGWSSGSALSITVMLACDVVTSAENYKMSMQDTRFLSDNFLT